MQGQTAARESRSVFTEVYTQRLSMPYLVVLPHAYKPNGQKWPILLYLHGAGDRGTDLDLVKRTPAVQVAESRRDYPFIFVAPQDPDPDQGWIGPATVDSVLRILQTVMRQYNADPARVYLTGVSMGGWGAWYLAKSFPEKFAAVAPLCGFPEVRWASRELAKVPIWTFHGTKDTVVSPEETENMVVALQKLGGNPKYTPLVGMDHAIAKAVYEREDLYTWFLAHRLESGR